MDAEIPQHEIVDRLEGGAGDPAVIPANADMRADDLADQPGRDGLTHVGEMRRPAAVLVDRELYAPPLGLRDQRLAGREVLDERLLRQDMLAGRERAPHQVDPHVGMGRDVEHRDPGIAEHVLEIVGGARLRERKRRGGLARAPGSREQIETTFRPWAR